MGLPRCSKQTRTRATQDALRTTQETHDLLQGWKTTYLYIYIYTERERERERKREREREIYIYISSISHSLNRSGLFGTMGQCASECITPGTAVPLHPLLQGGRAGKQTQAVNTQPSSKHTTGSDCWTAVHTQLYTEDIRAR